jgi:type VI secretion system protein ImpB
MAESTQHKLDRIRPPRVQITYDVETGGALVKKELPFIVGVLSDLSGKPEEPLPSYKQRRFVEIDRDNFNKILSSLKPRLAYRVKNTLREGEEESELGVELKFNHIEDFNPVNIAKQIAPLGKLLNARERLNDLLCKLDGNDNLDSILHEISQDTNKLQEIKKLADQSSEETEK